ncbi:MAG: DNA/RNA non-specific endonuclease [Muribaculaceae bacterium]|nr:DNA/RNA non-specific endonuclease [Muribaculaceae bacterium]
MGRLKFILFLIAAVASFFVYNARGNGSKEPAEPSSPPISNFMGAGEGGEDVAPDNRVTDFSGVGLVDPIGGISEQILKRKSYIVSYNKDTRCPNWVAWHLTSGHTTGDVGRMGNAFHEDFDVPEPRATNGDFYDSGFSRGHICPAGDNKWNRDAMYDTFLLSNICPQNANLNSGVWNQIEMSCRRWADKYGDIYIISGPMFFRSSKREVIGENEVAVPDAFFKIILCLNRPKAIGFICRNTDGNRRKDQYVNTLRDVERLTGMHFFPSLDPDIRSTIESHADIDEW